MAKKYYAVRQGHKVGIFTTWDECKKQVHGYSGAEYKSFPTEKQAQEWFTGENNTNTLHNAHEAEAVAYVDGSYNIHDKRFSCGVVLFHNGKMQTFSKVFNDPELAEMRNVAGEIKGSEFATEYCIEHKIKSLDIYYDYTGIEQWANGSWKTNKAGTRAYAEFICEARKSVDIRFVKVKGHSCDEYNDMADRLAKDALGIK